MKTRRCGIAEILALLWLSLCASAWGEFTHSPPLGCVIQDAEMPTLAGGQVHLLSDVTANVLIFFKPGQENSRDVLKELAGIKKGFEGKPVHWVGIISDSIPKSDADAAIKEAGINMPVLIDVGDVLYGKFDIALEPVTFICDQQHRLMAYQPFTRVNYAAVVQARIRYLLKEIDDKQLAEVLNPPVATNSSETAAAARRLKLAEMLFKSKSYEKALENVMISIKEDPALAAAHALRGDILVAQGKCSEAAVAFGEALKLDPKNTRALAGIEACQNKH